MIVMYDLVLGALMLLIIALLIWYIANVVRYLVLKNNNGKTGFFSLADKWLENEDKKRGK